MNRRGTLLLTLLGAALLLATACDGSSGGGGGGGGGGGTTACPEIFALGFRNPWRMNFDPANGRLYVGDVGQSRREEIDLVAAGGNYGWDCLEGDQPHSTSVNCTGLSFNPPEVVHDRTDAQAITGGVVYRGALIPELQGFYVYGDALTTRFFTFDSEVDNDPAQRIDQLNAPVVAFGQGRDGEIYAVTFGTPSIRKIVTVGSGLDDLRFADAFPGRSFDRPVKLLQHPTDDNRWYVVEQGGLVKTFLSTNSLTPTEAADVDAIVDLGSGNEQGLLGMAFDPNFASSREIYLAYTNEGSQTVVLSRWVAGNVNGLTFSPGSPAIVMAMSHGFDNHNGSDIMFGSDGFLYYSMGDGGGADDPGDNGQDARSLLGKILRIDVNSTPPPGKNYAVPATNPFAANAFCN